MKTINVQHIPLTETEMASYLRKWAKSFHDFSTKHLSRLQDKKVHIFNNLTKGEAIEEDRRRNGPDDFGGGFGPPSARQTYEIELARIEIEIAQEMANKRNDEDVMAFFERLLTDYPNRPKPDADENELAQFKADRAAVIYSKTLISADSDTWPHRAGDWMNGYRLGYLTRKAEVRDNKS